MGKSSDAPAAPNPEKIIPLQTQANKDTFDYATNASRINQVSPTGTVSWSKIPGAEQTVKGTALNGAAFDDAAYMAANPDVAASGLSAMEHYARYGRDEGRQAFYKDTTQPGMDTWTQTTALSPEQQQLYDANTKSQLGQAGLLQTATDRLAPTLSQNVDYSGVPGLVKGLANPNLPQGANAESLTNDLAGYRSAIGGLDPKQFAQDAADAQYRQTARYLDPQVKQNQSALEARLSEQGFVPGTPGYQQAMQNFMDTNARSYADARDRATTLGASIGQGQFGSSLSGIQAQIAAALQGSQTANTLANSEQGREQAAGNFQNNARTQSIAEILQQRAQPLNELNALRTGTQVQTPTGNGQAATPNMANTDVIGPYNQAYQGQIDTYNADVGSKNATWTALAQAAAAAAAAY